MYDYLIIGHGIAGAVLSHELISRGYRVMVFDQPQLNNSSMVAAGLYNPVTGRKMIKTWLGDLLFPEIEPTYEKLEKSLSAKFLNKIGIYRPFVDVAEQNDWSGKRTDEAFKPFIDEVATSALKEFELKDPYGGLHLLTSGFLDIPTFLSASTEELENNSSYSEANFDDEKLQQIKEGFAYENIKTKKVIFCNGLGAKESFYFSWLPFSPVKGEVLIGKMETKIKKIYNRGIFILPSSSNEVKIGSTYKNRFDDAKTTEEGKTELLDKLTKLTPNKLEITAAKAGIRPATKDRRPFIGKHPEYEHIYIFNGFGSKGVSLVPFFTKNFVEYLEGKSSLLDSVDINRYKDLYPS